ncbi:MAG: hypothetical protein ACIAQF_04150 [Phycisphaerales bacterium JB065]
MDRKSYKGLITLNVLLIVMLVLVSLGPSETNAQNANRARGQYTAIGMKVTGSDSDAIVLVDSNNQELVALRWDSSRRSLVGIDYASLQNAPSNGGGVRR